MNATYRSPSLEVSGLVYGRGVNASASSLVIGPALTVSVIACRHALVSVLLAYFCIIFPSMSTLFLIAERTTILESTFSELLCIPRSALLTNAILILLPLQKLHHD